MADVQLRRGIAAVLLALALVAAPMGALADTEDVPDTDIPKVETAETVARPKQKQAESPLEQMINDTDLHPVSPKSAALDDYLDDLMPSIIDDDMTTYQQVKACYDYLVANTSYGSHTSRLGTTVTDGVTCRDIYSRYGEVEGFGAVALTAQTGMCNAYASAFILMVRKIGLEANLAKGSTRGAGGGYVYHEWAEVTIDGQVYLFDPQLEQNLVASGLPRYSVFCKTYDQVSGRYSK